MAQLPTVPDVITAQEIKQALPTGVSMTITPEILTHINGILTNEDEQLNFRENLLSYTSVMKEGKFKTADYISAVHYVSQKALGATNEKAYIKTWPDRYQRLLRQGASDKTISAYVHSYNKSKLVTLVLQQTLTPAWIVNQANLQRAINVQVEIMNDKDVSPKVRSDAANSIMTHMQMPEVKKVELDIAVNEGTELSDLRDAMRNLAKEQQSAIQGGTADPQQVAHQNIVSAPVAVDGEVV